MDCLLWSTPCAHFTVKVTDAHSGCHTSRTGQKQTSLAWLLCQHSFAQGLNRCLSSTYSRVEFTHPEVHTEAGISLPHPKKAYMFHPTIGLTFLSLPPQPPTPPKPKILQTKNPVWTLAGPCLCQARERRGDCPRSLTSTINIVLSLYFFRSVPLYYLAQGGRVN